jgi:hypothetical protein
VVGTGLAKARELILEMIREMVAFSRRLVMEHDVNDMMCVLVCDFYGTNHIESYISYFQSQRGGVYEKRR